MASLREIVPQVSCNSLKNVFSVIFLLPNLNHYYLHLAAAQKTLLGECANVMSQQASRIMTMILEVKLSQNCSNAVETEPRLLRLMPG